MNISASTMIDKLKRETAKLSVTEGHSESMYDAMQRIHLLSELWLESYKREETHPNKSPTTETYSLSSDVLEDHSKKVQVSDEDTSIFDF